MTRQRILRIAAIGSVVIALLPVLYGAWLRWSIGQHHYIRTDFVEISSKHEYHLHWIVKSPDGWPKLVCQNWCGVLNKGGAAVLVDAASADDAPCSWYDAGLWKEMLDPEYVFAERVSLEDVLKQAKLKGLLIE